MSQNAELFGNLTPEDVPHPSPPDLVDQRILDQVANRL
jgi:hypothetical protein